MAKMSGRLAVSFLLLCSVLAVHGWGTRYTHLPWLDEWHGLHRMIIGPSGQNNILGNGISTLSSLNENLLDLFQHPLLEYSHCLFRHESNQLKLQNQDDPGHMLPLSDNRHPQNKEKYHKCARKHNQKVDIPTECNRQLPCSDKIKQKQEIERDRELHKDNMYEMKRREIDREQKLQRLKEAKRWKEIEIQKELEAQRRIEREQKRMREVNREIEFKKQKELERFEKERELALLQKEDREIQNILERERNKRIVKERQLKQEMERHADKERQTEVKPQYNKRLEYSKDMKEIVAYNIPGYYPDDLSIFTKGRYIYLNGNRICSCDEDCVVKELMRRFFLPEVVDTTSLTATLDHTGTLSIKGVQYQQPTHTVDTRIPVEGIGIPQTNPTQHQKQPCNKEKPRMRLAKMKVYKQTGEPVIDEEVQYNMPTLTYEDEQEGDGVTIETVLDDY